MTYNPDYERSRIPGAGLGEYHTQYDKEPMSGKGLLIILAVIVALIGGLAFLAGNATVALNESEAGRPLTTEAPALAPTTPATQ